MAKKAFRCKKCKRNFSMAAHLGRHMSSMHGAASGGKRAGRKKVGRPRTKTTARRGRPPARASLGAGRMFASRAISEIKTCHNDLLAQRRSLDAEINALARALRELGASPTGGVARRRRATATKATPGRKRGRPAKASGRKPGRPTATRARRGALKEGIARVLRQSSKPLGPQDIGARLLKTGFKTKSKDITRSISNTLPKVPNLKRIGFGKYTLSH